MNICDHSLNNLICNKYTKTKIIEEDFTQLPRPYFTFSYVSSGILECKTNDCTITVYPGEIAVIPFQMRYKLRWAGENGTTAYSFHFNFLSFSEPFGNRVFPLQKVTGLTHLKSDFEFLCENCRRSDHTLETLARAYVLCSAIYPLLAVDGILHINPQIQKAIEYINANYSKKINVEELARMCTMSVSRFYDCFKKNVGTSPVDYKNSVCLKHAALLLIGEPQKSIETVSFEAGFASSEYFRRLFKAATGKTPREYRKEVGKTF